MELFYNPERMSETEIRETFVAHQWLVDEIISIVKKQPKGAAVQHVVIVAPRGMGKTTLLLMLRLTVLNHDVAKRWQPVLFPEESYSVYDLADLWVEVLDHLASETGETELHAEVEKLKTAHPDSADLEPLALARIKDWHRKHKKRLLMLVDSLDLILEQIGNEKDNASLRHILMNDGTMMFVGASTTFFKEMRAYEEPLYNFFKIYDLNGLNSEQIEDLLRRRAKLDGIENFEEILRANRTRLRVLEYFTGGNPRLVLMLYRVITQSQITEVRRGLEKLLDEVTPYYKAKIETLPPQQRKILDQIARISAQTREGLTPTEIAAATRLAVNQVSSQLKRLADDGYVRAANIRGRSSYYTLSEPLYAIWHQMRFGREVRTKMNWLVTFLRGWYDAKELGEESQRLQDLFRKYLSAGLEREARDALEHRRYVMEAIDDQQSRLRTLESIILGYLELSDVQTLKSEMLAGVDINLLTEATQYRLRIAGLLSNDAPDADVALDTAFEQVQSALREMNYAEAATIMKTLMGSLESLFPNESPVHSMIAALEALFSQQPELCLINAEKVLQTKFKLPSAWTLKGLALYQLARFSEAAEILKHTVEFSPRFENFSLLALTLHALGHNEEALANFDNALQIRPDSVRLLYSRAHILAELDRKNEVLSTFDRAIYLDPNFAEAWHDRGLFMAKMGQFDESLKNLQRAVELNPQSYDFLNSMCRVLRQQNRADEALGYVNQMLQLEPESADAYFLKGNILIGKEFDSAINALKRSFALTSSSHRTLVDGLEGRVLKVKLRILTGELDNIENDWNEFIKYAKTQGDEAFWLEEISGVIRFIAEARHWTLARELIISANLEQPLFPMARALHYLIEGDEAIIEKLSPEMRTIVNEIVTTFKQSSGEQPSAPKKTSSRKRKRN